MKTRILDREYRSPALQPQSDNGGESNAVSPALALVADHFRIHPARFSEDLRGPGAVSRARQVAIFLVSSEARLSPWALSQAFGLDLSTVKNALARVKLRCQREPGFEQEVDGLRAAYRERRSLDDQGVAHA